MAVGLKRVSRRSPRRRLEHALALITLEVLHHHVLPSIHEDHDIDLDPYLHYIYDHI